MSGRSTGWGWPLNSRKAHFFVDGRSLCGTWMYFGAPTQNQDPSPDDCRACAKKARKLLTVLQPTKDAKGGG